MSQDSQGIYIKTDFPEMGLFSWELWACISIHLVLSSKGKIHIASVE